MQPATTTTTCCVESREEENQRILRKVQRQFVQARYKDALQDANSYLSHIYLSSQSHVQEQWKGPLNYFQTVISLSKPLTLLSQSQQQPTREDKESGETKEEDMMIRPLYFCIRMGTQLTIVDELASIILQSWYELARQDRHFWDNSIGNDGTGHYPTSPAKIPHYQCHPKPDRHEAWKHLQPILTLYSQHPMPIQLFAEVWIPFWDQILKGRYSKYAMEWNVQVSLWFVGHSLPPTCDTTRSGCSSSNSSSSKSPESKSGRSSPTSSVLIQPFRRQLLEFLLTQQLTKILCSTCSASTTRVETTINTTQQQLYNLSMALLTVPLSLQEHTQEENGPDECFEWIKDWKLSRTNQKECIEIIHGVLLCLQKDEMPHTSVDEPSEFNKIHGAIHDQSTIPRDWQLSLLSHECFQECSPITPKESLQIPIENGKLNIRTELRLPKQQLLQEENKLPYPRIFSLAYLMDKCGPYAVSVLQRIRQALIQRMDAIISPLSNSQVIRPLNSPETLEQHQQIFLQQQLRQRRRYQIKLTLLATSILSLCLVVLRRSRLPSSSASKTHVGWTTRVTPLILASMRRLLVSTILAPFIELLEILGMTTASPSSLTTKPSTSPGSFEEYG